MKTIYLPSLSVHFYKKIYFILLVSLVSLFSFTTLLQAQTSTQQITYQGKLVQDGIPFSGSVSMIFELVNPTTNTVDWTETQTINVQDGLYSVVLGSQTPFTSNFFSQHPSLGLRVSVNGNALTPVTVLHAVPYAHTASSVSDNSITSLKIVNGTIQTIDIASGGANKVLVTDATGQVIWIDRTAITAESDPKVGSLTNETVPFWNGTTLVDGSITDDGSNVNISNSTSINDLSVNDLYLGGFNANSLTTNSGGGVTSPFSDNALVSELAMTDYIASQLSGIPTYTAGDGIDIIGNQISAKSTNGLTTTALGISLGGTLSNATTINANSNNVSLTNINTLSLSGTTGSNVAIINSAFSITDGTNSSFFSSAAPSNLYTTNVYLNNIGSKFDIRDQALGISLFSIEKLSTETNLTVDNINAFDINADGDIELDADGNIEIDADGDIQMQSAGGNVEIGDNTSSDSELLVNGWLNLPNSAPSFPLTNKLYSDGSGNLRWGLSFINTSSSPLTFESGLTNALNTVRLGGALTQNTQITTAPTFNLEINGAGSFAANLGGDISVGTDRDETGVVSNYLYATNQNTTNDAEVNVVANTQGTGTSIVTLSTVTQAGSEEGYLRLETNGSGASKAEFYDVDDITQVNDGRTDITINSRSNTETSSIILQRSRGDLTNPTTIAAGDILGNINFDGFEGSGFSNAGGISMTATSAPLGSGIPSTLSFHTGNPTNGSVEEKMTINSRGIIGIKKDIIVSAFASNNDFGRLYVKDSDGDLYYIPPSIGTPSPINLSSAVNVNYIDGIEINGSNEVRLGGRLSNNVVIDGATSISGTAGPVNYNNFDFNIKQIKNLDLGSTDKTILESRIAYFSPSTFRLANLELTALDQTFKFNTQIQTEPAPTTRFSINPDNVIISDANLKVTDSGFPFDILSLDKNVGGIFNFTLNLASTPNPSGGGISMTAGESTYPSGQGGNMNLSGGNGTTIGNVNIQPSGGNTSIGGNNSNTTINGNMFVGNPIGASAKLHIRPISSDGLLGAISAISNNTNSTPVVKTISSGGHIGAAIEAIGTQGKVANFYRQDASSSSPNLPVFTVEEKDLTATGTVLQVMGKNETDTLLSLHNRNSNTDALVILAKNSGNINIFELRDNGNAFLAGGTLITSDRRYKKQINTLDNSLSNILSLRGTNYYWKDKSKDDQLQFGVIAQEIEEVFPNLVHTNNEGYKSVNYIGLVPVLIEATKEQQTIIDEQKEEIETQKIELENLKKQITELKTIVASLQENQNTKENTDSVLAKKVEALEKQLTILVESLGTKEVNTKLNTTSTASLEEE